MVRPIIYHWVDKKGIAHTYEEPEFISWLKMLLAMGKIKGDDFHMASGKFYDIPTCCVKWFVFMYRMRVVLIGQMADYLYGTTNCGHVKCPKCIKEELKRHGTNYPKVNSRKVRGLR